MNPCAPTSIRWSRPTRKLNAGIAYVWHASVFTREVLNGLLRIDFLYPQQIIWNKGRTVLTRTHYWYQHEPCWYVRKKKASWFGKAGENSTIWDSPCPKSSVWPQRIEPGTASEPHLTCIRSPARRGAPRRQRSNAYTGTNAGCHTAGCRLRLRCCCTPTT